jgi:succinoglycan biosynthesis transport protein ExoP
MDANTSSFAADSKLHFLDYWRVIRIRKTVIIAVLLLVVITVTAVTYILPESYRSTVRIAVDKDTTDIAALGQPQSSGGYDPYFIRTEFEKIKSTLVLHEVIERLNLNQVWARRYGGGETLRTQDTYQRLLGSIALDQSRNTSLIEISVYSPDKKEAAIIANTIAEVYRDVRLEQRTSMGKGGLKVLQSRLKEQDEIVSALQEKVNKLRAEIGVTDIDAVGAASTMEPETLRRYEAMRVEAQTAYVELNTLLSELQKLTRAQLRRSIVTAYPDQLLSQLLDNFNQAEQRLATLIKDYGEQHPDVQRAAALLTSISAQVDERLEGIMTGLETRVKALKARQDEITSEVARAKQLDIEMSRKTRPYFEAKRDLEKQQQIRDTLNLKITQETIDQAIPRSSTVQIIDAAEEGRAPVRPNKPLNITLGLIIGLIAGIGLAFFIEYLDTSVKTLDDVERALQAPVLGVIPQNVGSLLEEGPESPHAEAYRVLRSNMLFTKKDGKFNTMCVISAGAGEGKSTTLFNLAVTFAQNGQRVVVVDSDLRRPSIHKRFKVSNAIGLTNYLQRQNTLEEVIQTTSLPTLDFLPSGKLPSSSMGILNSVQMKALIHELKRRYDFVFFDSPPILGVSDASILTSEVDMTLLVVQYRKYPQAMTLRAKQMVEKVGGNLIGVVLNNINMAHDSYYYYYSGFYSNYYAPRDEGQAALPAPPRSGGGGGEAALPPAAPAVAAVETIETKY